VCAAVCCGTVDILGCEQFKYRDLDQVATGRRSALACTIVHYLATKAAYVLSSPSKLPCKLEPVLLSVTCRHERCQRLTYLCAGSTWFARSLVHLAPLRLPLMSTLYYSVADDCALAVCAAAHLFQASVQLMQVDSAQQLPSTAALPLPSLGLPVLQTPDGVWLQDVQAAVKHLGALP
jgi:hypothetical protein